VFLSLESQTGVKVLVKVKFGIDHDSYIDRKTKEITMKKMAARKRK
jgi:hypothetical protein